MRRRQKFHPTLHRERKYFTLTIPRSIPKPVQRWALIIGLVAGSNLLTHQFSHSEVAASETSFFTRTFAPAAPLYLMEQAQPLLQDADAFAREVRAVAAELGIPADWLMSVMHAESRFDPAVVNRRGSKATGLIQFMPGTAAELGVTATRLGQMTATEQLPYVHAYLAQVRERYGPYQSLTDLYLAIIYPKARAQDYCFTLYAKPSVAYQRNSGLDRDKDGRVSVSDVDRYMRDIYPEAYVQTLAGPEAPV